ncbi:hypothetical protein LZ32DRAFT_113469 [Colletotrichum eremochloae]|nr:hypothetical protein LZ32DRAFT_113469 [Colletotrichum eremochloae]
MTTHRKSARPALGNPMFVSGLDTRGLWVLACKDVGELETLASPPRSRPWTPLFTTGTRLADPEDALEAARQCVSNMARFGRGWIVGVVGCRAAIAAVCRIIHSSRARRPRPLIPNCQGRDPDFHHHVKTKKSARVCVCVIVNCLLPLSLERYRWGI